MAPPAVCIEREIDVRPGSSVPVTMMTVVAVDVVMVETTQTSTAAIPTLTVVEVIVRVFALNNTGPDCHLGVYTDVSMVNVVMDVVMLVLNYRLIDDIAADQGPRRMMWV
jgi:hypothetical protein